MSIKNIIEDFSKEVKALEVEQLTVVEKNLKILSLPVPEEYKAKYDELQTITGRKFGKLLQEVLKKAIDSVGQ